MLSFGIGRGHHNRLSSRAKPIVQDFQGVESCTCCIADKGAEKGANIMDPPPWRNGSEEPECFQSEMKAFDRRRRVPCNSI